MLDLVQYVTAAIPHLGGVLSSIFGGVATGRKFKRIKEVITKLADDLAEMQDSSEEYLRSEDFEDILDQTLLKIAREHNAEKRLIYKRLLQNAILSKLSYEQFFRLRFLRTIEELHPVDIAILRAILQPPKPEEEEGLTSGSFIGTLKMRTELADERIIERIVGNLNRLGITNIDSLKVLMNVHGSREMRHKVTNYGKELIAYILGDE